MSMINTPSDMAFLPEEDAATIAPEQAQQLIEQGVISPAQPGLRTTPQEDVSVTKPDDALRKLPDKVDVTKVDKDTDEDTDKDTDKVEDPSTVFARQQLEQRRESAFTIISSFLKRANIGGLEANIRDLLSRGIEDTEAVLFSLRDTPEFQRRFKANIARREAGMAELDFATYVGLENSYRETMQAFGLPPGFYDDQEDFEKLIEGDVSIAELTNRIRDGFVKVRDADPEVKRQMQELYGVSDTDLAAYFIDPKRARPLMMAQDYRRQATAAQIAARGAEQGGLQLTKEEAESLAARGITPEEAQAQFAQRGQLRELFQEMGGEDVLTREQKLGATFGYDVQAQEELRRRAQRRVAQFQGGGSFTSTRGQTSGTIETGLGGPQ